MYADWTSQTKKVCVHVCVPVADAAGGVPVTAVGGNGQCLRHLQASVVNTVCRLESALLPPAPQTLPAPGSLPTSPTARDGRAVKGSALDESTSSPN